MSACKIASLDSAHKNGQDGEGVNVRLLTIEKSANKFNSALWLRIKDDQSYSKLINENAYEFDEKEIINITSAYLNPQKSAAIENKYKFKDKKTGSISYGSTLPTAKPSPATQFKEKLLDNKYPISDNNDYWVPIGLGQSVEASNTVTDCDVSLIPVFPVTFLEPTGRKLQHLRNGYIYIYMNGFLWREISVVSLTRYPGAELASSQQASRADWTFYDINLAAKQGEDIRNVSTTTQGQKAVIVFPRKVGGKEPKFEVCFSEHQWTWDHICRMGGMDKDNDPRYIADFYKNKLHDNVAVDQALRKKRLQEIDLNSFNNSTKSDEEVRQSYLIPIAQAAEENNNSEEIQKDPTLRIRLHHLLKTGSDKEFVDSGLPALVLLDPLRVAWQLREKFMADYFYMVDWHQSANENNTNVNGMSLNQEVTLARYVSAILKGNEQLNIDKKLVQPGYDGVISYYDKTAAKMDEDCEIAAETLIEYLTKERNGETEDHINSVDAALCDFGIDFIKDDETKSIIADGAMEYWTGLIEQIQDTEIMQSFLEDELEIETSVSNRVLGIIHTESLTRQVKKDLDYAKNKITIRFEALQSRAAVQNNIKDSYNLGTKVHSVLGNFVNIFTRVMNGKMKKVFSATNKLDKESAKQIIKTAGELRITGKMNMDSLLATLSRIYNKHMTIDTITYKDLKMALSVNTKMNQAGTILAITPRSGFPESHIVQIHIDGKPVSALSQTKDFGKKYVLDMGTKIIIFMQVMSTAMAWQQLVKKGISTKQDVIKLFDTSFKTINLAATTLKMALEYSARKNAELVKHQQTLTNLFYGKVSGTKIAIEMLGAIASLASIGSSIMGVVGDLERANEATAAKQKERADAHKDSANINKFSAISTSILLVSSVGINLLSITTGVAGLVFAVIPIIGLIIAIVVAIAQYKISQKIANLTLTPIEKWLKYSYWGTEPYKETYDTLKEGWLVTDYSTLKNNFRKELEIITEFIHSFSVRTVWTHENKYFTMPHEIEINHKKSLVIDISLTNYVEDARLYLEVTTKGLDGESKTNKKPEKILYSDYVMLTNKESTDEPWRKQKEIKVQSATIKRFEYIPNLPSRVITKPSDNPVKSKTIRFIFDDKYIDKNTLLINAKIVLDPFASGNTLIPDFDGVNLEILKKENVVAQVKRASSIKEYRFDQKLDHNRNIFLEYKYQEHENDT